ncbi:tripartite tricarboxylate transporter permease [Thermodesulfobacteriota bacterium]
MIESMVQGISVLFQPVMMLSMFLAVIGGLIFGVLPGLSGMTFMAIFIPFTWGMDPALAMTVLVSAYAVASTGGSITSILVNIPGVGPSAATLLDGFPMTQQGKAGRALGAMLVASGLGGVEGSFVLALLIPMVMPIVMAFGSPESFFLIAMGLSFIAALGHGSKVKAAISGLLGLLLAYMGYHDATGFARYTFGSSFLLDGVKIIPCALAIFAMPEMIHLMISGGSIVKKGTMVRASGADILEGVKDVFRHWWLHVRCVILGVFVGIVPGVGGDVAVWVAYGHAKSTSKHPETFGQGNIEGVIGPESASNGKEGGAMLPTLALGIPGSGAMAVLLGAFLIQGIQPGPAFLREHLDLAWTIVGTLVLSNLFGIVICLFIAPTLIKVTRVRGHLLAPLLLCIMALGTYCYRNSLSDVFLMLALSFLGWTMRQLGYSRPAFFLGYVLGGLAERYFGISILSYGWKFFLTPISLTLIAVTIFSIAYQPVTSFLKRRKN